LCYVVVCGHGESPAFKIPGYGQRPYSIWFQFSSILGDFELFPFRKRAPSEHKKTRKNPKKPEKMGKPPKTSPTPSTPRIREKCRELPPLLKHAQNRENPEKTRKTEKNPPNTHTHTHPSHSPHIYIYIYTTHAYMEGWSFWKGAHFGEDPLLRTHF